MNQLIISAVLLFILDSLFIYLNSSTFATMVKDIQGSPLQLNWMSGLICYLFLIGGLNYFILQQHKSVMDAFLLGLVIYGVYETTTYAAFKKWRIQTVLLDTLWGGVLFATTTYLTYKYVGKSK